MPRIETRQFKLFHALRHRYIFQDPVRFLCLVSAGLLVFMKDLPFELTFFVVATVQLGAVALVAKFSEPGWSYQWGTAVHPAALASRLCLDVANLSASTIVGALLLVRHFNGAEVVKPLGILIVAVCLLPDVRFCRWILSDDPQKQSRHLRTGYFWRDPVKLGAILSAAVVCLIDRGTLYYMLMSIAFLQANTLLVMVDKYMHEIEIWKQRGLAALLLEREGQRLAFALAPFALVPLRYGANDMIAWASAAAIAALIIVPDVVRLALAAARASWSWLFRPKFRTIEEPSTIIGVIRPHALQIR
jgi:hypothetical protein